MILSIDQVPGVEYDTTKVMIDGVLFLASDIRVKVNGIDTPECKTVDTDRMVVVCLKTRPVNEEIDPLWVIESAAKGDGLVFEEDRFGGFLVEERRAGEIELQGSNETGEFMNLVFPDPTMSFPATPLLIDLATGEFRSVK